jgi:UDP-GlcNAc:undecaprenyl-phosphate/decaprenyl-phosphate GlcNAc-1-phosphate transferase
MELYYLIVCLVAFFSAFLLSFSLVPLIIKTAIRLNITDNPNLDERKIHEKPIPLLGGWSVFLSFSVVIILIKYLNLANFSMIDNSLFWAVIVAGLILTVGGSLDDKFNLKPRQQIIFPVSALLLVLFFGLKINYFTNPFGGVIHVDLLLGSLIPGLWLMGMMYTTKFLDGLDGLVAGIGVIASIFIFLVSLRWDVFLSATGIWGLVLAGSCLGFLIYNWQPAKIFLGEGGSVLIGFMLGVLSVISGSKIVTTLLVMGLPALDVLLVIMRRLIEKKSPFQGDRSHFHYRLISSGLSKREAVLILYCFAIAFGGFGLLSSSYLKMILIVCLMGLVLFISYNLKTKNNQNNIKS